MKQPELNYALFMETFFNHSVDAITIIGADNIIQYVNPAFEALYGLSADTVVGKNVWTLWPENTNDFPWMASRILQEKQVSEYETRRRTAYGHCVDVSLTISPIRDLDGNIRAYLTVGRDITEKKRMERALLEVESMFRLIEGNISDAVAIVTRSGRIEYASTSYETFLGIRITNIIGGIAVDWIHPDDINRTKDIFINLLHEKKRCQLECRLKHRDGYWLDVETAMTPIMDDNGEVRKIILVSRDITDRRRAEQLLLQAEKLSVVGQLGAALAHEIRNPLTSVKGFFQLLNRDTLGKEHYFSIIFSELQRIEDIIGDFLNSAKPQINGFQVCDAWELLRKSISVMQLEAHMHNIEIRLASAQAYLPIRCDEDKLKQVFVNVIKNAIESMSRGGVITVNAELAGDDRICIQITDQGCGISADLLPQLGHPFYTTKEKGTGMGLAVCSKILHEHKGEMSFVSSQGEGTQVSIKLPKTEPLVSDADSAK
ncbi:PAS domain-containing sensor histidine kinase [Ferviditalea candida]|uniref:histidine kinase n=1 Tax=Ferviditalea candida TaxID=3108399 RepID=A0ABU5ZPV6_9BACL|nr:PAS domain S-box protein [Paenibacillaceae bacterium T2]